METFEKLVKQTMDIILDNYNKVYNDFKEYSEKQLKKGIDISQSMIDYYYDHQKQIEDLYHKLVWNKVFYAENK